jgi:hypothetical protein
VNHFERRAGYKPRRERIAGWRDFSGRFRQEGRQPDAKLDASSPGDPAIAGGGLPMFAWLDKGLIGAPEKIRTPDPQIRSHVFKE